MDVIKDDNCAVTLGDAAETQCSVNISNLASVRHCSVLLKSNHSIATLTTAIQYLLQISIIILV